MFAYISKIFEKSFKQNHKNVFWAKILFIFLTQKQTGEKNLYPSNLAKTHKKYCHTKKGKKNLLMSSRCFNLFKKKPLGKCLKKSFPSTHAFFFFSIHFLPIN